MSGRLQFCIGDMENALCTVAVPITGDDLERFIKVINGGWEVREEEVPPLTLPELMSNDRLMEYIVTEAVEDGVAMYDPGEFWNNDGWCDWQDYREIK